MGNFSLWSFEAIAFLKRGYMTFDIQQNLVIAGNKNAGENGNRNPSGKRNPAYRAGKEVKDCFKERRENAAISAAQKAEAKPFQKNEEDFLKNSIMFQSLEEEHYGLGLAIAQSIAAKHHTE